MQAKGNEGNKSPRWGRMRLLTGIALAVGLLVGVSILGVRARAQETAALPAGWETLSTDAFLDMAEGLLNGARYGRDTLSERRDAS